MCLIIFRQKDEILSDEFLQNVHSRNSHGWGITFVNEKRGKVQAPKGMEYAEFIKVYRKLEKFNLQMLIHFRYATSGVKDLTNCHPFKIGPNRYLMHNGVFKVHVPKEMDHMSDTNYVSNFVIGPLVRQAKDPEYMVRSEEFRHVWDEYCDKHNSRMAIMDLEGPVFYGDWHQTSKGVYVSNDYAYTVDNPKHKVSSYVYQTPVRQITKKERNLEAPSYSNARPKKHLSNSAYDVGFHEGFFDRFHGRTKELGDWSIHNFSFNTTEEGVKTDWANSAAKVWQNGYEAGWIEAEGILKEERSAKQTENEKRLKKITDAFKLGDYESEIPDSITQFKLNDTAMFDTSLFLDKQGIQDAEVVDAILDMIQCGLLYYIDGEYGEMLIDGYGMELLPNYVGETTLLKDDKISIAN